MNALFNIQTEKDPSQRGMKYQDFLNDPLGEKVK